jgi:hypothetical protein
MCVLIDEVLSIQPVQLLLMFQPNAGYCQYHPCWYLTVLVRSTVLLWKLVLPGPVLWYLFAVFMVTEIRRIGRK